MSTLLLVAKWHDAQLRCEAVLIILPRAAGGQWAAIAIVAIVAINLMIKGVSRTPPQIPLNIPN